MKKIISIVLIMALLLTVFSGCSEKDTSLDDVKKQGFITCATSPDFAPNEFYDLTKEGQDSIVGHDIALAYYIAEYLGVELKIDVMGFKECQAAVSLGKVDFSVSGFGLTTERQENYNCSAGFIFEDTEGSGQGVLILAKDKDVLNNPDAFEGKKVAAQNASMQLTFAKEQLKGAEIEIVGQTNIGVMMLLEGKVDALATSIPQGEQFVKNYKELAIADFEFTTDVNFNTALMTKGDDSLTAEINKAIEKAKQEGLYEKWYKEAKELADTLGIEN